MATELNEKKLRKELIGVYKKFIEDKDNKDNIHKMFMLSGDFFNATDLIRSKAILVALNDLDFFISNTLSDGKDPIDEAQKRLKELENEK